MKRIHKQLLTAGILVFGGGGAGLYTLYEKVKTPEERLLALRESQRLFRFGRADVARGVLETTTGTVAFEVVGADEYRLTQPVAWPGDPKAFASLLDSMAGTIMDRVLTEDADDEQLRRAGLDRPASTLRVELRDGQTHTMHIGRLNKLVDRYPVTDGDKKIIGFVATTGVWNFERPVDDFRSKQVFATIPDRVTEVRVTDGAGEPKYSLSREDNGWTLVGQDDTRQRADDGIVGLFLVRITKNLEADDYVTDAFDSAEAATHGLSPPALHIAVKTADDTFGAKIGFVRAKEGEDATTYILVDGSRTLIRNTDPTLQEDLLKPARTFVDRTVSRFDPRRAQRLVFHVDGQRAAQVDRAEGGWRLTQPETRDAKAWRLDAIVRTMARLRVSRWHRDEATATELDEWRLAPAARRLTIHDADDEILADVSLGKYADDTYRFVKAEAATKVGLIDDTVLRTVPERWEQLVASP